MTRKAVFKIIFIMWIVVWVFFLAREDKDGQYASLISSYKADYAGKLKILLGEELYGFIDFCLKELPENSTYRLEGFEKFSIFEVRARYLLYPLKQIETRPDYVICFGRSPDNIPGYMKYKDYQDIGAIYKKENG